MWKTDYTNVLIADWIVVALLLISSIIFKSQRIGLISCAFIYGFFTYAWHYGFGIEHWFN